MVLAILCLRPQTRYTLPNAMNGRGPRARRRLNKNPGIAIATAIETESVNGIGGFDDRRRLVPIGVENHVKHMLHSSCGQTISGTLLIYVRSLQCPSAEETFTPHKPKSEPKQF